MKNMYAYTLMFFGCVIILAAIMQIYVDRRRERARLSQQIELNQLSQKVRLCHIAATPDNVYYNTASDVAIGAPNSEMEFGFAITGQYIVKRVGATMTAGMDYYFPPKAERMKWINMTFEERQAEYARIKAAKFSP